MMTDNVTGMSNPNVKESSFLKFVTWTSLNRIWRAKFIARTMIFSLIMSVCSSLIWVLWSFLEWAGIDWLTYILLIPLMCISIYWGVWLNNKRFHDRWQSWWWQLLLFVPIVNFIVILYLWLASWDKWENKYWEQSETKIREKVLAWLLPILIIFIIVWIFAAALLPRMQSAQNRARDVARKTALSQIQSAIVVSQMSNWQRPWMDEAKNWISVSNIEADLKYVWLTSVPVDPLQSNKNSWLWNSTSNWEYLYLVAKRNWVDNWAFVLMAKSETEWGSNRVICNNNWIITTETDLADVKLCSTVSKWNSCSNSNGTCTYTSDDQLRYVLMY